MTHKRPSLVCIHLLIAACIFSLIPFHSAEGAAGTVRIMAFNIQHGKNPFGQVDLERTASAILELNPDIVFLSEVDQHWKRSGMVDQPKALSEALAMPYAHFAPAVATRSPVLTAFGQTARYGSMFLSKTPFADTGVAPLPRRGRLEPRNVLWVDIQVDDRTLRLFGTHLSVDSNERQVQLVELRSLIENSPFPSLVVGDLNAPPDRLKKEAPYLWLKPWHDAHTAVGDGEGLTFPAPSPHSRIDYIFLHENLVPWLTLATTPTVDASDHLPVVVELSFHRDNSSSVPAPGDGRL